MPGKGLRVFLFVLFVSVAALQVRLTWTTIWFVAAPERVHYRLPVDNHLTVNVDYGELRLGDRVVEVNGRAVRSRGESYRALLGTAVGDVVPVVVERAGARVGVRMATRPFPGLPDVAMRVYTVVQNILTPWFCTLLGFFVVYQRMEDRMAWIVLSILLGQAQVNSFLFQVDGWGMPWSVAMRFFNEGLGILGAAGWLWLGLDFAGEQGKRLMRWLRWPLTAAVVLLAVWNGLESAAEAEFPALLGWLAPVAPPEGAQAVVAYGCLLLGYANLVYRLRGERNPDKRSRLQLLVWGLLLGRGPLLALELAAVAGRGINSWPFVVSVSAFLLSFLVPVTFAYVLIVARAMDVGVVVRQGLQYGLAQRSVDAVRVLLAILPVIVVENRWLAIGWSLLALLAVKPLAERLRRSIDKRFFREEVRAEEVLAGVAARLRGMTDTEAILVAVSRCVSEALHVEVVEGKLGVASAPEGGVSVPIVGGGAMLGVLRLGQKKSEEPYSKAERRLLDSVAHQAGLALENAQLARELTEKAVEQDRLERELDIAKNVQTRLLPKGAPRIDGLEVAGYCRPAQSIGGDSFDYVEVGEGRYLFTIADVAGKGISAALLMSNLQACLRGMMAARGFEHLQDVLFRLNTLVYEATPSNRFITLFAALYDPATRRLVYSSAGHNPLLLVRADGKAEWLKTAGVALGLRRHSEFVEEARELMAGDCLVLYTDGITEAMNGTGEEFGEKRLEGIVREAMGGSAEAVRDAVVGAVDEFAAGMAQHDDLTLVVVTVQ